MISEHNMSLDWREILEKQIAELTPWRESKNTIGGSMDLLFRHISHRFGEVYVYYITYIPVIFV